MVGEQVFVVLNYRYNHGLQTIITTNYGLKALAERMVTATKDKDSGNDVQCRRIPSRICGMCHISWSEGGTFGCKGREAIWS